MAAETAGGIPEWQWQAWSAGDRAEPLVRDWLASRLDRAPAAIELSRDAHGRPRLAPAYRGDVSWSHSGNGLVMAFARAARVGIDLERERPRPRALALARRFFPDSEAEWLQAQDGEAARSVAFLRLWCAREAVLKAHGRGLAFGLDRLAFAEHAGALVLVAADPALGPAAAWRLHEFVPRPGYRAAIAWKPADAP